MESPRIGEAMLRATDAGCLKDQFARMPIV